ncbi:hypothetical protein CONLIGDRAFT_679882 [Coniochaeta ligniaria NRRL 30616]|uniref:CFEM domain-containing protein n=1 Tax=Coniochaeta ligniaria NRRL 30616 TaxID=1408157 RepID=A0A1J7JMQ1_9PEZI|nr:hypothetical protein CONLIGDRAFT_679882 [Coniochaeta ligniaria NRRL 30616]
MRSSTLALLGSAALSQATWWDGAPNCAHTCLSSAWSSASATAWPSPGTYCTATQGPAVASCLSSACAATPTAYSSYSSLSSSLCSQWSSCSSAGSTGVYTLSAPPFTGTGGPHGGPPGAGHFGPPGDWSGTQTWTGGVYTVTGCEWAGSPWAGGPGGWGGGGGGGYGDGPWGQWGNAWSWTTRTLPTVTATVTVDGGAASVITAPATIAVAVSGDVSSTTTLGTFGAAVTGNAGGSEAAGGLGGGNAAVKVVAVALGAVGVVVAML